jgi:hypothetical protein
LQARQAVRADLEAAPAARKTFKDGAAGWRELIGWVLGRQHSTEFFVSNIESGRVRSALQATGQLA